MTSLLLVSSSTAFLTGCLAASIYFQRELRRSVQRKNLLQLYSTASHRAAELETSLPRALEIGKQLTSNVDETSKTAQAVGKLVLERSRPEATAAAVVVRNSASQRLEIGFCSGAPESRIRESLLSFFEMLQDGASEDIGWGVLVPKPGQPIDFSRLGIGSLLSVPIYASARGTATALRGMIWLGFGMNQPTLSPEKLAFIKSVCEYCSAAFETAEKVQERLAERERQRDLLLGMSHDLRAPGNSALYALRDLLSESLGPLSTEQRVRLRIVEECLEDQLDMLSDIIDYTRNQRGLLAPARAPLALREGLPRLLEWFRTQAEQRGLIFQADPIPDAAVLIDPRHFKRVISNLLSNAVKYTERGYVRVGIEVRTDAVCLSFSDSGIGIPEAERHLLFHEFSRLSTAGTKQGSGLGLVIVRELLTANGGTLRYRPNSGGGSVFEIEIPLASTSDAPGENFPPVPPLLASILVVDDDPAVCRTNQRFLSSLASEVLTATNNSEALKLLAERKPEVLVSDLHLGTATAENLLRYLEENNLPTAAVLLTGSADRTTLNRLDSVFPIHWLPKPAGREALRRAVCEAVAKTSVI